MWIHDGTKKQSDQSLTMDVLKTPVRSLRSELARSEVRGAGIFLDSGRLKKPNEKQCMALNWILV